MNRICFYPVRPVSVGVVKVCLDVPESVIDGAELYDTLCPVKKLKNT